MVNRFHLTNHGSSGNIPNLTQPTGDVSEGRDIHWASFWAPSSKGVELLSCS